MDPKIYPIGKFEYGKTYTLNDTLKNIAAINALPAELNALAKQLSPSQLEKSYRPGGWSARQIIHHIADSHSNALIRIKLALTEDSPVIKPYDQDAWALLGDVKNVPVQVSLDIRKRSTSAGVALMKSMSADQFHKKYIHPEYNKEFQLNEFVAMYAWHGKHHCGHLQVILNEE